MTVTRKLFFTISAFIVVMGLLFALLTLAVVKGIIDEFVRVDRSQQIAALSAQLTDYYSAHQRSWAGIGQAVFPPAGWNERGDVSFVLRATDGSTLYRYGEAAEKSVVRLGQKSELEWMGNRIGTLYFYDSEVADKSIVRIGISSSVTFLLLAGTVLFVALSLVVAHRTAKKLTEPLRKLLSAIQQLGEGRLGVQARIAAKDEYGQVAEAFNTMSVQLKRTEEARRKLVADVAHELRTPLTIIRGQLELLQQEDRAVAPERLLPLHDEVIRLTRLVDDLHQLSLAEARRLPLDRQPTDLVALLEKISGHIRPDAAEKAIDVRLAAKGGPYVVSVDRYRITQVFLNLLANAVRFTPERGQVTVTVEREEGKERTGFVRVTVNDSGPGIAPEHLPHVFNRFYRGDASRARTSGGMGLGLAIAKEFVLAHGGTIDVESRLGEGTTFVVRLPE